MTVAEEARVLAPQVAGTDHSLLGVLNEELCLLGPWLAV